MKRTKQKQKPKIIAMTSANNGMLYVALSNGKVWEMGWNDFNGKPEWDEVELPWNKKRGD